MEITIRIEPTAMKELEDTLARAVTRGLISAIRVLARDGMLPAGLNGFAYTAPAAEPEPPPEPVQAPEAASTAPEPEAPVEEPRKRNRSLTQVCKTVADRPNGYTTTEVAHKIIQSPHASHILRTWIYDREIPAVIVAGYHGTPTKGLPGRLMVETEAVHQRDKIRRLNRTLPPIDRRRPGKISTAAAESRQ